jgi:hypothetical protein
MNTKQMEPTPMTEDQLEYVKKEITRIYFFLISKTGHDPMIVELMKLSALADVQKRYETKPIFDSDRHILAFRFSYPAEIIHCELSERPEYIGTRFVILCLT